MALMSDLHMAATRVLETDATVEQVARETAQSEEDLEWAIGKLMWD